MDRTQILVVEDEAIVAMDIQSKLEELGYSVIALIRSGKEAVQTACEMRPDIILMDIVLQGDMDGIAAAACIQERSPTPVVYMTAHGDKDTLDRVKMTEPMGFIIKPFNAQELQATIEVALNKHRMVVARESIQRERAKEAIKERTVELAQRHRELAALNTAFQKHLRVRGEEERDYREFRMYVKDIVNQIQGSLDELDHHLQYESMGIGPILNHDRDLDTQILVGDPPSQGRNGQGTAVSLTAEPQHESN